MSKMFNPQKLLGEMLPQAGQLELLETGTTLSLIKKNDKFKKLEIEKRFWTFFFDFLRLFE